VIDDLIAFARARLDEDEAVAKAAHLRAGDHWNDGEDILFPEVLAVIARHDPARTLREVEAGRRILARYEDCLVRMEDPGYPHAVARDQAREYEDFVLPNLIASWSDHPGYRQEWAP
jgi:hypothetical protein